MLPQKALVLRDAALPHSFLWQLIFCYALMLRSTFSFFFCLPINYLVTRNPITHKYCIPLMKKLLLFLFLYTPAVKAQVFIGPEFGMNTSNLKISYPSVSYKNRLSTGFRAGLLVSLNGDKNVMFNTGLCYYGKGSNITASAGTQYYASNFVLHSIQLPLYASIQSRPGRYGRFFLGAGAFLDYHFSGKESVGENSTKFSFGNSRDDIKRIDAGLALQGGYRVNDGVSLRLQYQYGLPNLVAEPNQIIRTRSFGVTIAYMGKSGVPKPTAAK